MQDDDEHGSPLALHHSRLNHATSTLPYCSTSVAACASASQSSVWSHGSSDSLSQSIIDDVSFDCLSTISSQTSVSSHGSVCLSSQQGADAKLAAARTWQTQQQQLQRLQQQQQQQQTAPVAASLRQHPRRSSVAPTVVPSLLRQSERRTTFVDHLVDASTQIVQAIWPLSSVIGRGESVNSSSNSSYLLPLRTFIQETLRRSRASYSTLQVALYYLLLIKPRLPSHNFTMEQSTDSHACRALQCGRRMFLAALILASKYLQDRNYSARAWSKISGLSTAEINQNETAFLHAVNWRLHITNEVYNKWIECVNRFNSPQMPPSPGPAVVDGFERKCFEFRILIQKLSPDLENLDELCGPSTPVVVRRSSSCQIVAGALSPVSMCSSPEASAESPLPSTETTPLATKFSGAMSGVVNNNGVVAPALGLLPTPKLAPPQAGIFNCTSAPVASAPSAAQMLSGSRSSMCFAVAQASSASSAQFLDRWPPALPTSWTSPVGCNLTRRSSLANSVSTASSPESMISDSSLVSRASSVASSWSLMNAPSGQLPKLDTQARHRFLKHQISSSSLREKSCFGLRAAGNIPAVVPEDYEVSDDCSSAVFASPETMTYTGPVGNDALGARRSSEVDATDAARALADLQQQSLTVDNDSSKPRAGLKRSRPVSGDATYLQDNVRDLLRGSLPNGTSNCGLEAMVVGHPANAQVPQHQLLSVAPSDLDIQAASRASALTGSRKRFCRTMSADIAPTANTTSYGMDLQHPSMSGICGPGMWQGILN
ncbi:G1/S-specific cyclin Pcl5 [Sporothrix schenckii 1099-18]|uniref:G1/S-specific cyclin Pcl5 n=1 Tax=Sporothrix schenckii 1099-18 TaxID=1397361 RepID=A0A0F2MBG8_SPOSC|nr:G1/S-specific cyclin Pcl5 [Sporothrix schenckii 1099-18]KJR85501.1 G1/S-specific cyclin Pcl5 [Sporothrix schenckii 1099-18]